MTTAAGKPFRLFTARYGIMPPDRALEHDESRHLHDPCDECEPDGRFRCRCPGHNPGTSTRRCCCRATQEDRLCDWCRDGCVGTINGATTVLLADVSNPRAVTRGTPWRWAQRSARMLSRHPDLVAMDGWMDRMYPGIP